MKKTVFIDMDNVLVDFQSGLDKVSESVKAKYAKDENGKPHYDDIPGIFAKMEPMLGALEGVRKLSERYELYILSTAPWDNPSAWSDKLEWVKKYFSGIKRTDDNGKEVPVFHKRLILSHHKDLCCKDGAFLIDDRDRHGAKNFGDNWLHFGKDGKFKDWNEVVEYLVQKDREDTEAYVRRRMEAANIIAAQIEDRYGFPPNKMP